MKQRYTFLLLLPLLIILFSCNKDDDKPADPVDLLPPATQTGANTAGCLVDGEPFIPKGPITGGNLRQYYDGKNFFIRILRKSDDNISTGVGVFLEGLDKPLEMGKINVLNIDFMGSITKTGLYHIGSAPPPRPGFYQTNNNVTGEMVITHHDFDNAILSGTFWFDAINSEGEIVEVREGRFDIKY